MGIGALTHGALNAAGYFGVALVDFAAAFPFNSTTTTSIARGRPSAYWRGELSCASGPYGYTRWSGPIRLATRFIQPETAG